VTAGGPTVAIRVPDHPVALALLDKADVPIAAPSANPSNWISPTSAKHVQRGLDGKIDAILDGGPCRGGIESTVLSLVDNEYRILRCGLIDRPALESVLDRPVLEPPHVQTPDQPLASPGMLQRHYAPNTQTELASGSGWARVERLLEAGNRVGWMRLGVAPTQGADHPRLITRPMPTEPRAYAAKLYATLHELDSLNIDRIVCAEPPDRPAWSAIRDRLRRATAF
jgi:L-threonylcarbamoyladenylate synthase